MKKKLQGIDFVQSQIDEASPLRTQAFYAVSSEETKTNLRQMALQNFYEPNKPLSDEEIHELDELLRTTETMLIYYLTQMSDKDFAEWSDLPTQDPDALVDWYLNVLSKCHEVQLGMQHNPKE